MDVGPEPQRRIKGKTRPISLEQSRAHWSTHTLMWHHKRQREIMLTKKESVNLFHQSPQLLKTTSQHWVQCLLIQNQGMIRLLSMLSCLREPTGMSGESGQGSITEEAFFTVSPGGQQMRQRNEVKMKHLSPAEKREFLKSMQIEWQALLKSQSARVLSLEETVQARARWPRHAMDTRWARTWKPDESKPSGRRAKARLIIKGFTEPDFFDMESHSPTLTREGFMTVLQSVCSHGHYNSGTCSRRSILETWSREDTLRQNAARWNPRRIAWSLGTVIKGLADGTREWRNGFLATARGIGSETSVLEPCVLVLRGSQQRYHGVIGVAVDDIAGG